MIREENKNEIGQLKPKKKCAANPAPKNVTTTATVISFTITGPTLKISSLRNVNPPSNRIILIAKETK